MFIAKNDDEMKKMLSDLQNRLSEISVVFENETKMNSEEWSEFLEKIRGCRGDMEEVVYHMHDCFE